MNRNLKRVLSLALTLIVMAVNFVIPAMAEAPISVEYTDLLSYTLTGGQGTLFYDTSSTGVDTPQNQYSTAYAPLEVRSNASQASLTMKASEWVRFEAEATTAGYYSVDMTYGCGATAGADMIIRTGSNIVEAHVGRTGTAYTWATAEDLGYVYLEEGTNYIYVDNKSAAAQVNFKGLTLTLDATADLSAVKLLAPVEGANEVSTLTVVSDDGYNQAAVTGAVTFDVNIPTDGKYKVSVMGKASGNNSVSADFGDDAKTATVSNDAYGYTEIGVFSLTEGAYTLTLNGFTDYSLAWAKIEYVSPYLTGIEDESFVGGDTVARGTDNLTITFNDNMMDTVAATLTKDGTQIPVAVDAAGTKVIVSFLETLAYETEYTLTVTGLQGVNDAEALEDRTYTFTTSDEASDAGTDDVTITDATSSREDVTIEGTVMGSTGHGIKGRTVKVTSPEGAEVASVTSGDNGAFTAEFTIADGTDAGVYTYTVTAEYGATDDAIVSYISEAEELRILDLFLSATTPEAVYSIFEAHSGILAVPNYAADCASLANDDLFLAHFEGKDFAAVTDVAPFYNKMLKVEGMNQETRGGSFIASDYLNNAATLELMGINFDELKVIPTNKLSDLGTKIYQDNCAGVSTSYDAFVTRMYNIVKDFVMEANGITAATLDLTGATATCYYAGEIAIPLDFAAPQTKVKKVVVTVTTANAALLNDAEVVASGATTSTVISGNTATFTLDYEYYADKEYDDFGKVSLTASLIGTYTFTVGADVTYRVAKDTFVSDMLVPATGGTVTVTVNPTPSDSTRPTGGTGGGYVAPPKEKVEDEEDTNKSQYFFDDMGEALWAQDMVHTLVGKGIISKNTERAFRPMDNISREEVVKMLVTVVGSHNADAKSTLTDVSASHWATSYIATAQELGIVQGNADGTFGLGQQITRQDLAVMIFRTFKLLGLDLASGNTEFADAANIAGYAHEAVSALEKQGILNGMGDGTFAPQNNATRAQAAKVIYVMMEVLGV